ncbi:MAG: TIR domain-containing protein [Acidobacteriaceae bacterium]
MSGSAFMSYSRDDSAFALRLAQDLKAAGAQIWLDQLDIKAGTSWDNAIEEALSDATHFLIILSPASSRSSNVRNEISYAMEQGKIVIPVLYTDCTVPLQLQRTQRIDFRADYDRSLHALVTQLQSPLPARVLKAADAYVLPQPHPGPQETSHPEPSSTLATPHPKSPHQPPPQSSAAPRPQRTWRNSPATRIGLVSFVVVAAVSTAVRIHHDNNPDVLYQNAIVDSGLKYFDRAARDYKKACRLDSAKSCTALAVLYQTGKLGPPEEHSLASVGSFGRGCDLGDATACGALGRLYYIGKEVQQDVDRAFKYDQQACKLSDSAGCAQLGILYARGEGVARNPKQAIDNFKKACNNPDPDPIGCSALGKHYASGDGVPKDPGEAKTLDQKACNAGHASACTRLGDLYSTGNGGQQSSHTAKEYYQEGCLDGDEKACDKWLQPPPDTSAPKP